MDHFFTYELQKLKIQKIESSTMNSYDFRKRYNIKSIECLISSDDIKDYVGSHIDQQMIGRNHITTFTYPTFKDFFLHS